MNGPTVKPFVHVECYSGYKADQKPIRFELGGKEYFVEEILDQWYGPNATYFRVCADDGNIYVIRHNKEGITDSWTLESFRRA